MTWKEAFNQSPGPRSLKEAGMLYTKGVCMGTADVIPGVSGGTIALITGIYEQLLSAIQSIDTTAVRHIFSLDFKAALSTIHARFLFFLLAGIATAIFSLARLMNYLLLYQPVPTWSLFFGLIAASTLVVGRKVTRWKGNAGIACFLGIITGWIFVSLVPVSTPEELWFIFVSGFVAICAMILPGISGAFLLLVLGKYTYITGTLKNPFLPENFIIICVFCAGCATGLLSFSRVLRYLLTRWHNTTLAFLTGLLAGSMKKIWPWKEALETVIISGKVHVLREKNIMPDGMGPEVFFALLLVAIGFVLVIVLERLSRERPSHA